MSVIRLSRPDATAAAEPSRTPVTSASDLDGFDSESAPPAPPSPAPQETRRSRGWVTALLAVLVVAEAGPAALWVRDQFQLPATPVAPAPAVVAPPPALVAAPPCEAPATPEPAAPAPTAPAIASAAAIAAAGAPPIAAGILAVEAPIPLRVYSRGRVVGTTEAETLMLPAGAYDFEFVNDTVGFRTQRTVTLQAGRRTSLHIDMPSGTLHVNAVPWAEVLLGSQRLGETPIGNARVPLGAHELVFRHPEFGERRARVLVTLKEPARISIDMRKP